MAKLYFYYASMNAGKSTKLLQADFNYRERGMATMLWTAALDTRTEAVIAQPDRARERMPTASSRGPICGRETRRGHARRHSPA